MNKQQIISRYLPDTLTPVDHATAFAPSNIALCKYWGKRDKALNLPINGSLSVSLGELGTTTTLRHSTTGEDSVSLNGQALAMDTPFAQKVFAFIELFRREQHLPIAVATVNSIPTAAGLASSASGFAALTLALNDFLQLALPLPVLSAFARMGSGSASRSLYSGFVEWHKGQQTDGMDSFAEPLPAQWADFRVGIVKISSEEKTINSRDGMNRTRETSQLYQQWPAQAERDLCNLRQAIVDQDFPNLGRIAEHNALSMHATMISSWPPVLYWQAESIVAMQRVWALRERGSAVYFTMDAGPNIKLLFLRADEAAVKAAFPAVEVVAPFAKA